MAKEFGRNARVSSQMQKELSLILQRDIDDSRLGFITINEVVVTKDLAVAKVYVTVLNVDEQGKKANVKLLERIGAGDPASIGQKDALAAYLGIAFLLR